MKTFLYGLIALTLSIGVGLIAYQLLVKSPTDTGVSTTAVCGNGVQEPSETCDDGNLVSGDGCSAQCVTEADTAACESTTETFTATLSSPAGSCVFPTGRKNGVIAGFNEVTQAFPAGNVCAVTGIDLAGGSGAANFYYDDSFAISLNQAILIAAHSPLALHFPTNGSLNIWDSFSTIDKKNITSKGPNNDNQDRVEDPPVCAGGFIGSHSIRREFNPCYLPTSEIRTEGFSYSIPDSVATELGQYLQGASNYTVTLHAVGDDHESVDCHVSEIEIVITVETKPAGCDCGFTPAVCGNGVQEIGEECDGDGSDYSCVPAGQANECTTVYECSDGLDNDGDGFIDCTAGAEDPGCFPDGQGGGGACNPKDNDEEDVPTQCSDGIDNDGDGFVDCTAGAEDPGCFPNGNGGGGACNPSDDDEEDNVTQCNDGIDNDGDGFIDCTAGAADPGCFPNGNGGGGTCNPNDDNETDLIAAPATIPNTAFGDDSSQLLILGFTLVITGLMVYKLGFTQKFIDWVPSKAKMYEEEVAEGSDKKRRD